MKNFLLLMLLTCTVSFGQFKNSAEKTVFAIDNGNVTTFKLSGGETALEYNFYRWEQVYVPSGKLLSVDEVSSKKVNAFIAKFGLVDVKKFVDADDFKLSKQGFVAGISYLHSADTLFIVTGKNRPYNFWTYRLNAEYKFNNFNNYDPTRLTDPEDQVRPSTVSLSASASRYFFNLGKLITAVSINGTYSPVTYNSNELLSFKKLNGETDVVTFQETDGLYGSLNEKVCAGYTSLSLPLMWDYQATKWIPYVVPVPFASSQYISTGKPKYFAGINFGFFGKSIFGAKKITTNDSEILVKNKGQRDSEASRTQVPDTKQTRLFGSPSFLSVGVDWTFQNGVKASEPNFFITGTITVDRPR